MKKTMLLAALAAMLAGCQSAPPPVATGPKLQFPVNSKERFNACAAQYDASSKQFADCWGGTAYTRQEICVNGSDLLDSPYMSEWRKAQIYEMMRNNGCMGGK
jgi:hypothetical protein